MAATNCTANVPRRHQYAFSTSGQTALSKRVSATNWGLKSTTTPSVDNGNTGLLWTRADDYVIDRTKVSGQVVLNPRPADLLWMLPIITGGTFSGAAIKPAPTCPFFRCGRYDATPGINSVFTYVDCVTSKAVFSSSDAAGSLLQLAWDIESKQMARSAANTWPTGMTFDTTQPFVHAGSVLNLAGNEHRIKDISITIDNMLMVDEFYNSRYREDFPQDGQKFTLAHTSPFDLSTDLALLDVVTSVSAQVTYTNGNTSIVFDFPALRAYPTEPAVGNRGSRVTNQITWEACLATGAGANDTPVTITVDATP
jgi:hypothetical protein